MKLSAYLNLHDLSLREFSRRCGKSASSVMRIRDGAVVPSRKTMDAIYAATDGTVTASDLVERSSEVNE